MLPPAARCSGRLRCHPPALLQRCSAGPPAAAAIQQPCILQQQQRFLSAQGSPPHPRLPCTHSGISAPCSLCAAGADALSRYVDWRDRGTCILFGDGCGALVLTARDDGSCGLLGIDMHSGGRAGGQGAGVQAPGARPYVAFFKGQAAGRQLRCQLRSAEYDWLV